MNCPACGYYNPTGQERCFHCGLALPMPAGDALCARHPEVKATGACSRCGTFGCGACLAARDEQWLCPACQGRHDRLPWDEREQLGVWRAWWRTSALLISSPVRALENAEPDGALGGSMLYAFLCVLVGYVPTFLTYSLLMVPALAVASKNGPMEWQQGNFGSFMALGGGLFTVGFLGFQVAWVLLSAALDHVGLRAIGAQPKSYAVTVRANALSMAPSLMGLMPVCGLYVFPLWGLVLRILAIRALHRVSGGQATAAVLIPLVLCCGGVGGLYAMVIALAVNGGR